MRAVTVGADGAVLVDGKPAKTPLGNALILPNAKLAAAIAEEWRAQGSKLRKETMPLTQIACIAIDLARDKREAMLQDILPYAETDLICYRAGNIPELQYLQQTELDPLLVWARERFGVALQVTEGLMPIAQDPANQGRLETALAKYDEWKLAAFAACVKPLGSFFIALALVEGYVDAPKAVMLAHLEEDYETRKWGPDDEKDAKMLKVNAETLAVGAYLGLIQ